MIFTSRKSQVFALEIVYFSTVQVLVFSSPLVALESKTISRLRYSQKVTLLAALNNSSKYLRTSSYSGIGIRAEGDTTCSGVPTRAAKW